MMKTYFFFPPPIAIATLIENFGEKTTNKERAKVNEYFADSIRHASEEGFEIFIREGI